MDTGPNSCNLTGHNSSRCGFESFAWWRRSCCLSTCHVLAKIRTGNAKFPTDIAGVWFPPHHGFHHDYPKFDHSETCPNFGENNQSAALCQACGHRERDPSKGLLSLGTSATSAAILRENKQLEVGATGPETLRHRVFHEF